MIKNIETYKIKDNELAEVTSIIFTNSVPDLAECEEKILTYTDAIKKLYDHWTLNSVKNNVLESEFVNEAMLEIKNIFRGTSPFSPYLQSKKEIDALGELSINKLKSFVDLKMYKLTIFNKDQKLVDIYSHPVLFAFNEKTKKMEPITSVN